jgi:hypothetical protein
MNSRREKGGPGALIHIASDNSESGTPDKKEICIWISMIHSDGQ